MRLIENLSSDPDQRHTILFEESEIILRLRFLPVVAEWYYDAEYKDWSVKGIKLSLGVLHQQSQNQPFDFAIFDTSKSGLDPFRRDDFADGRIQLYLLEADDMTEIRGQDVPV